MRHYKVKTIQALERGIQVMAALREMRAASLHDLHLNTGIPKPTLTRILYTLYRQGLVWHRMADGAFLPSHILLQRGRLDDIAWLVEIASPVLEELCERVMWPSVLSVPRLDHMEVVETNSPRAHYDELPAGAHRVPGQRAALGLGPCIPGILPGRGAGSGAAPARRA